MKNYFKNHQLMNDMYAIEDSQNEFNVRAIT